MTIRIQKPTTKSGAGSLCVYRANYVKATITSGVKVPGHVSVDYVAALPRFTKVANAAAKLVYAPAKEGKAAPAPLTESEMLSLQTFLDKDAKNYRSTWDAGLVADIRAELRAELEQKQPADAGIPTKQTIKVLNANVARLVAQASELTKLVKTGGSTPREALYKTEYVPLEKAWLAAKAALQAAGIVAKRPRSTQTPEQKLAAKAAKASAKKKGA